jgi:hypothetical protein
MSASSGAKRRASPAPIKAADSSLDNPKLKQKFPLLIWNKFQTVTAFVSPEQQSGLVLH